MKTIRAIILTAACLLCATTASATTLVDYLQKTFKKTELPHSEVTVKIRLETGLQYLAGNKKENDFFTALKIQEKLADTFKLAGWKTDDNLATDYLDAGKIEIELGEGMTLQFDKTLRMKAFVHQCSEPMRKYRGGDMSEFFQKVLEDAERCFTEEEKLEGKNWPY